MIDDWQLDATRRAKAELIDTLTPNAARVADFLDGGRDSFEADRRAALLGPDPVRRRRRPGRAGARSSS